MAQIPNDVIYSHILPRLPVKSLTRFKCVSKSWLTLISSPDFIRLHHRHALSSDANRLVITDIDSDTHFVAYDLDSSFHEPLFYPYPELETLVWDGIPTVVASCDFFVLVSIKSEGKPYQLFLVNPSTHTYREIIPCPKAPVTFKSQTFEICLNETTGDYNVIMIEHLVNDLKEVATEIMKYSSVTNSWRLIGRRSNPSDEDFNWTTNNAIVRNNLLYMNLSSDYNWGKKDIRIDCFDIQAEQWTGRIPLPHDNFRYCKLRVLDGSLCVLGVDIKIRAYQVWVMKDCWVNLISSKNKYYPVAYCRGSRHELLCTRNGRFHRFNLRDKAATQIASDRYVTRTGIPQTDHVCRESLVTFPNKLYGIKQVDELSYE